MNSEPSTLTTNTGRKYQEKIFDLRQQESIRLPKWYLGSRTATLMKSLKIASKVQHEYEYKKERIKYDFDR